MSGLRFGKARVLSEGHQVVGLGRSYFAVKWSGMIRYCFYDGQLIPQERLVKAPQKAKFCSDSCRAANGREMAERRKAVKRANGKCGECGRRMRLAEQAAASVRVREAVQ